MNRTVKEATIKAFHYPDLDALKAHVLAFIKAYNFANHLKALRWRTPFQAICDAWTKDPSGLKSTRTTSSRDQTTSRKNTLFASGDDGGARWAAVASLAKTCKLNRVDPQRCLADLLTRLVDGRPNSRIDELMPWHWATAKSG